MARSKFPGKPSKQVNRTRVNVLPSTDGENTTNLNETKLKQVSMFAYNNFLCKH